MNYLDMDITDVSQLIKDKKVTSTQLVKECFARIKQTEGLNALNSVYEKMALDRAKEIDDRIANGEDVGVLGGVPIVIKDNINMIGTTTTCSSKFLENYVSPYNATVVQKLLDAGAVVIAKANMDEFAMGSCSKTSYFGAPHNPWNFDKITGGSSGGSAACVSDRLVPLALGSDTGGSIRQPAAHTGIVGMKPTYGRVSRFGLVAFASSMDQIGPMTRNVLENASLLNVISGYDEKDLTSSEKEVEDFTRLIGKDIKGMKIAVPNYFVSDIVSSEVLDNFNKTVDLLKKCGCTVDFIDIKYLENAVTLYQIIAMGEASSNLARFDGVRYGYSYENPENLEELYTKTRQIGFGDEVKRRIMVGSFILSGENAKTYYDKALSIRDDIKKSFIDAFKKYDFIIGPTTTTVAYDIKEEFTNPSKSFLDDVLVIPVNMAGLPGMNLPIGFSNNLPVGLHIIGNYYEEAKMYQLASFLEKELNLDLDPRGEKDE